MRDKIDKCEAIRSIIRKNSSRIKPITKKEILEKLQTEYDVTIKKTAFNNRMKKLNVAEYSDEKELDEIIKTWKLEKPYIILCKKSETDNKENKKDNRVSKYWIQDIISDSEWGYIVDSIFYSKIMTKVEVDNLIKRISIFSGIEEKDLIRKKMSKQNYFCGDNNSEDNNISEEKFRESSVLKKVQLIKNAIKNRSTHEHRRVKFQLCVYDYDKNNNKINLLPYYDKNIKVKESVSKKILKKTYRVCYPYEVIFSNGRYYMLGTDRKLQKEEKSNIKYKLYRIDLMTNVTLVREEEDDVKNERKYSSKFNSITQELEDLFYYRIKNPYMFTGEVKTVQIRIDSDQLTQIVDWFSNEFKVIKNVVIRDNEYYDIELEVNTQSFLYWVLQYSGCVEVIDDEFRCEVKNRLIDILKKYDLTDEDIEKLKRIDSSHKDV